MHESRLEAPGCCTGVVPSWISITGSRLGGSRSVEDSDMGPVFPLQKDYMSATNPFPSTPPNTSIRQLPLLTAFEHQILPADASPSTSAIPKPFSLLPNQKVLKLVAVRTIRWVTERRKLAISDMYRLCPSACVCLPL